MSHPRCAHCPVPPAEPCGSDVLPWLCAYAARGPHEARHAIARSRVVQEGPTATRTPRRAATDPMDCVWLGEPTGDLVECPTCSGTVWLKVFGCQLFETTHYRQCVSCRERAPRTSTPRI